MRILDYILIVTILKKIHINHSWFSNLHFGKQSKSTGQVMYIFLGKVKLTLHIDLLNVFFSK